jgi:hypothetical protein
MTLQHFLMFNWKSLLDIVDAAVLFVQDGGILYVKDDMKGGSLWRYQICSINIRLFCL